MRSGCTVAGSADDIVEAAEKWAATKTGAFVDVNGCSGEQLVDLECPCDGDWTNHGKFVSCVAQTAEDYITAGLITETEKDVLVSEAAKSSCGSKK